MPREFISDVDSGLKSGLESIHIKWWVSFSLKFLFIVFSYHTFLNFADSMRVKHSIEANVDSAQLLISTA
ncbi:MAG: hypothetical protein ACI88H_003528 [Cocleimonas sp.]|jgi:hypothetical protein